MSEQEWLNSLKPGDEVLVGGRWDDRIDKVGRVTATQIVVGGTKYRKSNGRRVGATGFRIGYISELDKEARDRMNHVSLKRKAKRLIDEIIIPEEGGDLLEFINDLSKYIPKP